MNMWFEKRPNRESDKELRLPKLQVANKNGFIVWLNGWWDVKGELGLRDSGVSTQEQETSCRPTTTLSLKRSPK